MRTLPEQVPSVYDVVVCFDNALPHLLTDADLARATQAIFAVTRPGGLFMASIRDYDALLTERPQLTSQRVMPSEAGTRVTFQLWEWQGEHYTFTQFILTQDSADWSTRHYTTRYWALRRATLTSALQAAGFTEVRWLMPDASGYSQPVVIAQKSG
jgi:SAM-dependent methyltransferase